MFNNLTLHLGKLWFCILSACIYSVLGCEAPTTTDFTSPPRYWCSLEANITIQNSCTTNVAERIVIPWNRGSVQRYAPKQQNQEIVEGTAALVANGLEEPIGLSEAKNVSTERNTAFRIKAPNTDKPFTVILRYKVKAGVQLFGNCAGKVNFPPIDQNSQEDTAMLAKWSPGGLSIRTIRQLLVHFSLLRNSRNTYLDSIFSHPKGFMGDTTVRRDDPTKTVEVSHTGSADGLKPGKFIFFFRYRLSAGWAECPNIRSCGDEEKLLQESVTPGISKALILALGIGGGLLVMLIIIAILVRQCNRISKKHAADIEDDDFDVALPKSLRHFAYDTGDDEPARRSAHSQGSVQRMPSICALSLSPKGKDASKGNEWSDD